MQVRMIHGARWDGVVVLVIVVLWAVATARCEDPPSSRSGRTIPVNVAQTFLRTNGF